MSFLDPSIREYNKSEKKGTESKAQTFGKYQITLNMEKSNKVCNVLWYYFSKGEQL